MLPQEAVDQAQTRLAGEGRSAVRGTMHDLEDHGSAGLLVGAGRQLAKSCIHRTGGLVIRIERKSLAITANTPFSQWNDVFVEPAMTVAAVDRLVHHSTILEMNVESYRRRAAQAAAPGKPKMT